MLLVVHFKQHLGNHSSCPNNQSQPAIDECYAKQTRGDKHVTIQNKAAESLEHEEDVEGDKDQDEMEEVDEEEEEDNISFFVEDSD